MNEDLKKMEREREQLSALMDGQLQGGEWLQALHSAPDPPPWGELPSAALFAAQWQAVWAAGRRAFACPCSFAHTPLKVP